MSKKSGGPAFPTDHGWYDGEDVWRHNLYGGMTLRDWFAGQALSGLLACSSLVRSEVGTSITKNAYAYADGMIKELEKENPDEG